MDDQDIFGRPLPPARSLTNKVTSTPDADDRSDVLTFNQRKEMDRVERLYAGIAPTPSPAETAWRHRHWLADRARVCEGMRVANLPAARRERFNACGAGCVVEIHRETKRCRVRGFYCGDRFCLACAEARAKNVKHNLCDWLKENPASMLTLTLKGRRAEPCAAMLDRLITCFAKLRRQKCWKSVTGGAWSVEVKRGSKRRFWHVHIHAIVNTQIKLEDDIREAWKRITGDSDQVHFSPVTDPVLGAWYVAKYVSKGWAREVLKNPEDLVECMRALGGRRLLGTFGVARPAAIERERTDPAEWKCLGRLVTILELASINDLWAVSIISCIGRRQEVDSGPTLGGPGESAGVDESP